MANSSLEMLENDPAAGAACAKSQPNRLFYRRIGKRMFDITFAILLLPLLVPTIFLLWASVRRDGGSGFFGHQRIGLNGQPFKCWKIRSMVVGAEQILASYLEANPEAAEQWRRDHKLRNDPRVTRWGKFLRKSSLDELPQIWNVLRGDMSFVGPRPIVVEELERYGAQISSYTALRPGITGLWQVSGRNDTTYDERVQMDVTYYDTASLSMDIRIILQTGSSVLNRTGL